MNYSEARKAADKANWVNIDAQQAHRAAQVTWETAEKAIDTARWEGGNRAQAREAFAQADKDLRAAHEAVLVSSKARINAYNVALKLAA